MRVARAWAHTLDPPADTWPTVARPVHARTEAHAPHCRRETVPPMVRTRVIVLTRANATKSAIKIATVNRTTNLTINALHFDLN